jgi:uncharacterized protein (DUF58 family)
MATVFPDFIPPDVRARLKDIALTARFAVGGHGFGQHSSRSRGAGLEFAQYRAYEPGDELRQVDWKLYARSDRYFVREAERDSPLTLWIVIDATASMAQADDAHPAWSRLDAAKALAACAIELALRQGDRFGLAMLGGNGLRVHAADTGPRQRDRCLLALQTIAAQGTWPQESALQPLWERIGAGALVLMIGDGFDEASARLAERLAAARREVVGIRILTVGERDFPFRGGYRFRDPESSEEVLGDGDAIRTGFLERFGAARRALTARLAASGIRQVDYVLDEALDLPLRRLFAARNIGAHAETA